MEETLSFAGYRSLWFCIHGFSVVVAHAKEISKFPGVDSIPGHFCVLSTGGLAMQIIALVTGII
jgi:hypothetical protein